jgi:RNA polymerase sigma-70 factor (ECF subfamily)
MANPATIASNDLDGSKQLRFDAADRGFVYAIGRRYVRDEDAADDVAQEAMLLAYRNRASFRGESHPRTWLYRIAATTALGYLRRQKRRGTRITGYDPEDLAKFQDSTAPSSEDQLATREVADQLQGKLSELDEKYASVMRLRAEDLREHEIAERLGITVATVKIRGHRARAMLREALAVEAPRPRAQCAGGSRLAQKSASSRMLEQQAA